MKGHRFSHKFYFLPLNLSPALLSAILCTKNIALSQDGNSLMDKTLEVFLSNRLEILYQQLKQSLFGTSTQPLMRRLVMVYGPAMKNWLSLRMAQDPDLNVAMGMEFIYLGQAFESLLELSSKRGSAPFSHRI